MLSHWSLLFLFVLSVGVTCEGQDSEIRYNRGRKHLAAMLLEMFTGVLEPQNGKPESCATMNDDYEDYVLCPTYRDSPFGPEWVCVRHVDLCNGIPSCPNAEDEHPMMCKFNKKIRKMFERFVINSTKQDF